MDRKVIITCALTGAGDTVGKSEHVPVTPEQIVASGIEAARAGAAIVHVHVRDPRTGVGSREVALYREVVQRLRASDVDVVINTTAGMGGDLYVDPEDPSGFAEGTDLVKRHRAAGARGGAAAGHLHPGPRQPELRRGQPGLPVHTGHAAGRGETDPGAGGAARAGDLRHRAPVVRQQAARRGPDRPAGHVPAVHGDSVRRTPPEAALLAAMVAQIPPSVVWASFAIGRMQMPWVAQSVLLGGHVRVGLENNLYLGRDNKVRNAALVANAVTIIRAMGAEVATPDEAREMLALRPRR